MKKVVISSTYENIDENITSNLRRNIFFILPSFFSAIIIFAGFFSTYAMTKKDRADQDETALLIMLFSSIFLMCCFNIPTFSLFCMILDKAITRNYEERVPEFYILFFAMIHWLVFFTITLILTIMHLLFYKINELNLILIGSSGGYALIMFFFYVYLLIRNKKN